jgi:tetratricopeptide (TPR) repeat protein
MGGHTMMAAEKDFRQAEAELAAENTLAALVSLEKALKQVEDPHWHSSLGYCIARERGQFLKGVELCHAALRVEPDNSLHYLNLGRIHLLSGNKEEALRVFREGITKEGSSEIRQKLIELGIRKSPLFAALGRSHPLNKYLGLILSRLGLR